MSVCYSKVCAVCFSSSWSQLPGGKLQTDRQREGGGKDRVERGKFSNTVGVR